MRSKTETVVYRMPITEGRQNIIRIMSGECCLHHQPQRALRKFCVSDIRQNQEYHIIHVHDGGLFPLSPAFPGGWDGMRAGTA